MTARTVPVSVTETPGSYITSAWQNAQVKALTDWSTGVPVFLAYQQTAQTVITSTFTAATLDTEIFDTDGGHSTTTNTSRYTVQVAGKYRFEAAGVFTGNATGIRAVKLVVNGAASGVITSERVVAAINGFDTPVTTSATIQLAVGDYVEAQIYQSSGGNLATHTNASFEYVTYMGAWWIST